MRSAFGLLPQGLEVWVQRLPAALLAGRVRLGQQDLRPLLGDGVGARAGLGLFDMLLVL